MLSGFPAATSRRWLLERFNARCKVKDLTQRAEIGYEETFIPTSFVETGRIVLALAYKLGWYRKWGDIPAAFFNPNLGVDLYFGMMEEFKNQGYIVRIKKGLYRLEQAALLNDGVKTFSATQEIFPIISDVFPYSNKEKYSFAMMYVDGFQLMGPNLAKIERLMHALLKKL